MLKNLLKTLKVGGQVFVYETEWSKGNGLNNHIKHHLKLFLLLLFKKIIQVIQLILFIILILL
jgi:hypothetical protein